MNDLVLAAFLGKTFYAVGKAVKDALSELKKYCGNYKLLFGEYHLAKSDYYAI